MKNNVIESCLNKLGSNEDYDNLVVTQWNIWSVFPAVIFLCWFEFKKKDSIETGISDGMIPAILVFVGPLF